MTSSLPDLSSREELLLSWRGNTPAQCRRRLAVKEAGFQCQLQTMSGLSGHGLIARMAARQAQQQRFPDYDPHSDPHLQEFFEKQTTRHIHMSEMSAERALERKQQAALKRQQDIEQATAAAASAKTTGSGGVKRSTSSTSQGKAHHFKRGGQVQASLARVSKGKTVRMPRPPPNAAQAPPPTIHHNRRQLSARSGSRSVEKTAGLPMHLSQKNNYLALPTGAARNSAPVSRPSSPASNASTTPRSSALAAPHHHQQQQQPVKMQLNFAREMCPELKALEIFRHQQHIRDDKRKHEEQRRAIHEASVMNQQHDSFGDGGGGSSSSSSSSSSRHRSICMPVNSDHILGIKNLFMRSAEQGHDVACRSPICALRDFHETFHVIKTRDVDLPDIVYMGVALSNHYRQIAGLSHMTATPSPEQIFNWLVLLGCTETVDWPSFLILCCADIVGDFEKVGDLKNAYSQFVEKTPLDCGLAYQKLLLYLKSVAGLEDTQPDNRNSHLSPQNRGSGAAVGSPNSGGGTMVRAQSFHANAFHEHSGRHDPVKASSFFQPGDFYGPRHTCSFADALFSLMPFRVQFHLVKANARGFSCSVNYCGRVPHSAQSEAGSSERSASAGSRSGRGTSRSSRAASHGGTAHVALRSSTSSEGGDSSRRDSPPSSGRKRRAVRHSKFKNAKSQFLEEQAAEMRFNRGVWL